MKPIKLLMIVTAVALVTFGLSGYALAFHDGGVAHCDGCHTMHNSENGVSIIDGGTVGTTGEHLTIGSTPAATCLNCHEGSGSYHVLYDPADDPMMTGSINLTPGGDFIWITKTFVYPLHGSTHTNAGDNHGHNVIAPEYGLFEDDTNESGTAPGGTYPKNDLYCSSCHDPHGKKVNKTGPIEESGSYGCDPTVTECGNYRLLGDVGYEPGNGMVTFTNPPPIATAASLFGPGRNETDSSHTDYGQGMSEWCSNCHTQFLASGGEGQHKHPNGAGATLGDHADNYNDYVMTGDATGTQATAYLALVPFERNMGDPVALDPTSEAGPASNSNVMCLTCHRAHASAFPNAGRWFFESEFPFYDYHPQDSDAGASPGDSAAAYYNRDINGEFDALNPTQRSLCNKCHMQD